MNREKSYTQINGDIMLCQKRNQQFNWHGDFIFHPKSTNDKSTPLTDKYLFEVLNCDEDYYRLKTPEKYVIKANENTFLMQEEFSSTIDLNYGRFRKLTPRECLRLMGFDDSFKIVVSDTETYKQAGNSIIVDVLIAIMKQLDITKYAQ